MFALVNSSQGSLILTGIIDGPLPGGTPKAIELFVTSDIPDLSLFGVELVNNAGSSSGAAETFFSGSALEGDFIYVSTETTQFNSVFGFNPDFITSNVNHNGDDDFYIYGPGDTLIDVWGGTDGISNSGTVADIADSWSYRINGSSANTSFTPAEWDIQDPDSLDGLNAAQTAAAFPFGTFSPVAVPEPSSIFLLTIGSLVGFTRKRRH